MKYPEYIDGIKQVQNPIHRLFIKTWYSDWFRLWFLAFPWWWIIILVYISCKFNLDDKQGKIMALLSTLPFFIGLAFNDYSNLRRIGLNEDHIEIKERKDTIK